MLGIGLFVSGLADIIADALFTRCMKKAESDK
jgi:hypothetical protein